MILADQNITGGKEIAEALRKLSTKVARNGLRRAVSAAAAMMRDEAKANAPVDTGEMRRDVKIKRMKDTRGGPFGATFAVYVQSGKKSRLSGRARNVEKDSFYWRFVEFGTSKTPAQPFMRPAYESKKEEAIKVVGDILDEVIQKAATEAANR